MSGGAKGIGLGIDFAIGNQYKRKGGKSYIDPAVLSSVVSVISTYGKTNEDADRSILKDKTGKGNDFKLLNFGFAGNSGYGLYSTDFTKWTKRQINDLEVSPNKISVSNKDSETALVIWLDVNKNRYVIPSYKIKVSKLTKTITYYYIDESNPSIRSTFSINKEGTYILPISRNDLYNGEENTNIGFGIFPHESFTIEQLPDFEGWLCTDGVEDLIESVKPVSEMLEGSNEITVVSIIHQMSLDPKNNRAFTNYISYYKDSATRTYLRNQFSNVNKTAIYGYTYNGTTLTGIYDILGDKADYSAIKNSDTDKSVLNGKLSVCGYATPSGYLGELSQVAYAGGFIANKVLTTDEINQIIAYYNLDRPGQIIKPQLYCNIKKQGITNDNHAEFNDQLIDFVGGHNIQLNNIGWKGESGIIDGALYLDGISDFGKATGLPILKDYTVVADRKILGNNEGGTLSKSYSAGNGAFIFETGSVIYSFGTGTSGSGVQSKRMLSYLSKYIYNGNPVQAGAGIDSDSMWLGTLRDNDTRFAKLALRSLLLFSYTLSEFLLERQLKKYNAGTLYPGMVEFRPIVKSNIESYTISFYLIDNYGNQLSLLENGKYYDFSDKNRLSLVKGVIKLDNEYIDSISSVKANGIKVDINDGSFYFPVTKSPQKIDITIDRKEVLSNIKNSTWISNEQLIKNK